MIARIIHSPTLTTQTSIPLTLLPLLPVLFKLTISLSNDSSLSVNSIVVFSTEYSTCFCWILLHGGTRLVPLFFDLPLRRLHARWDRWKAERFLLRILNSPLSQSSFNFLLLTYSFPFVLLFFRFSLHSLCVLLAQLTRDPFLFAQTCSGAAGHPGSFWNSSHILHSLILLCLQIFHFLIVNCQSGLLACSNSPLLNAGC